MYDRNIFEDARLYNQNISIKQLLRIEHAMERRQYALLETYREVNFSIHLLIEKDYWTFEIVNVAEVRNEMGTDWKLFDTQDLGVSL